MSELRSKARTTEIAGFSTLLVVIVLFIFHQQGVFEPRPPAEKPPVEYTPDYSLEYPVHEFTAEITGNAVFWGSWRVNDDHGRPIEQKLDGQKPPLTLKAKGSMAFLNVGFTPGEHYRDSWLKLTLKRDGVVVAEDDTPENGMLFSVSASGTKASSGR